MNICSNVRMLPLAAAISSNPRCESACDCILIFSCPNMMLILDLDTKREEQFDVVEEQKGS